jgi:hypothetical protein
VKHKINLAMPAYGSTFRSNLTRSLLVTLTDKRLSTCTFTFSEVDYSDISVSRNYLLTNFFYNKRDCSHILMVDSDMGFPPDLVPAMMALDKPVVGTIYPKRTLDLRKLHALSSMPFEKALARSVEFVGSIREPKQVSGGFVRMVSCGAGVLLISRGCVEKMISALPEIVDSARFRSYPFASRFERFLTPFNRITTERAELSEDVSFCHRWVEKCAGEIWACFDRKVSHAGNMTITIAYSDL